ncbi:hypothetical protein Dimus_022095 [Dionaea muscipula]
MKPEGRKTGGLPSTDQRSLFLGNLHKEWSPDEFEGMIREVFEDVEAVDLVIKPGQQQNRGFGFVKFSTHAAAAQAFKLGSQSDFLLGGKRHPTVEWAAEGPEIDPEEHAKVKVAFLRDLSTDVNEDYMKKLFEPYGKLEKIVLSKKTDSQVGFVHFATRSDLDNAIKHMNNKTIQGLNAGSSFKLQVEVARPFEKNKKRTRDEYIKPCGKDSSVSKMPKGSRSLSLSDNHAPKVLEEPFAIDPYEATVISLPDPVKDRLLRILRLGIATRYDIGVQCLRSLKELPEITSISILDQFMLSGADEIDKGAFLAGLIAKACTKTLGMNQVQLAHFMPRVGDAVSPGSGLPRFSGRSQVAFESSAHVRTPSTRYDSYVSLPTLDYRISPRPGIPNVDKPAFPILQPPVSLPSYVGAGVDSALGASSNQPTRQQLRYERYGSPLLSLDYSISPRGGIPKFDKPIFPLHQLPLLPSQNYRRAGGLDSPPGASSVQPTRHQMRFDPFTGEPFKFDPFTGEPILPEPTCSSRNGGLYAD